MGCDCQLFIKENDDDDEIMGEGSVQIKPVEDLCNRTDVKTRQLHRCVGLGEIPGRLRSARVCFQQRRLVVVIGKFDLARTLDRDKRFLICCCRAVADVHHGHKFCQNALTSHLISLYKKTICVCSPSVGPGADPDVQAVSPQVTISHPPGGRLPY